MKIAPLSNEGAHVNINIEQMARAIHSSNIANCIKEECNEEFDGFSGADYDFATILIRAYDNLTPDNDPYSITIANVQLRKDVRLLIDDISDDPTLTVDQIHDRLITALNGNLKEVFKHIRNTIAQP